jgi:predicted dehydrogenase
MRYLLVGLGNLGQKRRLVLGARCVATADPVNPEADFQDPAACPAETYDAVILAVPTSAKLALLEHFLELGKHVLVEKPLLFPDWDVADRLARLARSRGAIWYTSYNHRFEPLIERVRQELAAGFTGDIYYGRLVYGNGTVRHVMGSWREAGIGVLEDLGSHLLDLVSYLLGPGEGDFRPWSLERHESTAFDHVVFGSADGRLVLEASYLSWKNSFSIDLVGERGSLHLAGLPKWGPAELVRRERVLPSGIPRETRESIAPGVDLTWERDIDYFERATARGETSMTNDWWISHNLRAVAGE